MGVLVFALAILPSQGSDSVQLMRAEVPGPVFGKLVSKLAHTAQILYLIYLAMTAVLTIVLVVFKVPLFDALLLSFGTAGTGGFGINNAGFSIYANPAAVEWIIGVGIIEDTVKNTLRIGTPRADCVTVNTVKIIIVKLRTIPT